MSRNPSTPLLIALNGSPRHTQQRGELLPRFTEAHPDSNELIAFHTSFSQGFPGSPAISLA